MDLVILLLASRALLPQQPLGLEFQFAWPTLFHDLYPQSDFLQNPYRVLPFRTWIRLINRNVWSKSNRQTKFSIMSANRFRTAIHLIGFDTSVEIYQKPTPKKYLYSQRSRKKSKESLSFPGRREIFMLAWGLSQRVCYPLRYNRPWGSRDEINKILSWATHLRSVGGPFKA